MFRAFSLAAAISAFALAILGSWIRINGAGMTCPDWPLCHGAVVPVLNGGVVLEWSHRMVAGLEGILLIAAIITGWRARREIAGVTTILAALAGIFVIQVLLGAATVALSNSPWSVVLHWGMAMLFLATLTALAIVASVRPAPSRVIRQNALYPLLGLTAAVAFVVMCAGAFVSSSGAGLACSTLPALRPRLVDRRHAVRERADDPPAARRLVLRDRHGCGVLGIARHHAARAHRRRWSPTR